MRFIGQKSIHDNDIGITIYCILWEFVIEVKPSGSPLHFYSLSNAHQVVTALLPCLKLPLV
jgi:hypothetical protein